jgi:DNA-binding XRE family transcriptional regulator
MKIPYPPWITSMPEGYLKERAKCRFQLRFLVLYAHPDGHIHDLARMLGINPNTLKTQIQSNRVVPSHETIKAIERVFGTEMVPINLNPGG